MPVNQEIPLNTDVNQDNTEYRQVVTTTSGTPTSDGAGVRLTRMIGTADLDHIDPFLLFDVFESDNPDDYIAGFPPHPHRGFETVTYMVAGQMRHKDNAGNEGVIKAGGVQWMTAGRGIVHSEMPEQSEGLLWGTQLWVNLPREQKMTEPRYQEYSAADIPLENRGNGCIVRVLAGRTSLGLQGAVVDRAVEPLYMDVQMAAGSDFEEDVPDLHQAFVFVVEGTIAIGNSTIPDRTLAVLSQSGKLRISAGTSDCRLFIIAGRQLKEPVARGGPFVMNTRGEVKQAFEDYRSGRM